MDLWYRLELLVRSLADRQESQYGSDDAWEELESFLRYEDLGGPTPHRSSPSGTPGGPAGPPRDIVQAFRDLEVPVGSSLDDIRRAYRRQLVQYHPDRHADNADRHETASEITRRLTLAYQRLTNYYS